MLFNDDTSIFYSHSDPRCLQSVLNEELQNFDVWLKCNKLSVNIKKTNYIVFKPRYKKLDYNFSFSFGNQSLKQSNVVIFLGVYLDEHLTWRHHISFVCKEIAKSIGILFRSRFYLSVKTKLTLYYTLIYPYITYCNCTWSSTYVSNLNRILYLQKRAVRAITNSDYRAHSAPLFTKLGILDIFQVNTFQVAKFMFYYHNQLLPSMFLNLFVTSGQVHNYGTRLANSYRSHPCRTNLKQFTILYQGPKIWNSLPATITCSPSLPSFKKKIL